MQMLDNKLFDKCKALNLSCSITYQHINDFSVEIYQGKKELFYTDGHIKKPNAIKSALEYLDTKHNNQ